MGGGGDSVIPTTVFIITFVVFSAFIVSQFNEMLTRSEQNKDPSARYMQTPEAQLAANLTVNLYDPGIWLVNDTELNGANRWDIKNDFTMGGQTSVGVGIFRNISEEGWDHLASSYSPAFFDPGNIPSLHQAFSNSLKHDHPDYRPEDFVIFWQTWMGGTLSLERRVRYEIIEFDTIIDDQQEDTNFTILQLHLRYWVTGLINWDRTFGGGEDSLLWANHFNVSVATGFNASYGSISASTVIGQLLGMKLPNVPLFIQAMIAIPCYLAIIMICVLVVAYFWP